MAAAKKWWWELDSNQ